MSTRKHRRTILAAAIGMSFACGMTVAGCDNKGETGTVVEKAKEDPSVKAQDSMNAYMKENNIPATPGAPQQ